MPKITDVKVLNLTSELKEPIRWATGIARHRRATLVEIDTDDGVRGIGEADAEMAQAAIREMIEQELKPVVVGQDPFDIEAIWGNFFTVLSAESRLKGFMINAVSAVDIALWDVVGKILRLPLYRVLGGRCREKIRAYATGFYFKTDRELQAEAERFLEKGFTAMKIKIGLGLQRDERTIKLVRDVVGNDVLLIADANCKYRATSAIRVGHMLEKYDIYWFEEPVPPDDLDGYRRVRSAVDVPIAGGECEYMRYGFRDMITHGAVDVIQPALTRAGGFTECKKIAALASTWDLQISPHVWGAVVGLAAATHFIASTYESELLEFDQSPDPLRDDLATEPLKFEKGYVRVPDKPGLGIELDQSRIREMSGESVS